jgi:hypothetical protein
MVVHLDHLIDGRSEGGDSDVFRSAHPRGHRTKKPPISGVFLLFPQNELDFGYILGLGAFGALCNVEPYSLSFVQRFVTITLECGEVNKHILATVNLDEAKTLLGVEPLDFAFSQCSSPFFKIVPLSKDAPALQYSSFLSRVLAVLLSVELARRRRNSKGIVFFLSFFLE